MAAHMAVESNEKRDVKTTVHVDDIRPGAEGSIRICGEGNRHPMCVIQNGSKYVYIYENTIKKLTTLHLQGILHLPSSCQCMCVSRDTQGGEHLILCLKDGRVLQQNVQCFNMFKEETRAKKKKKKKDKHKVKDKLTEGAADPPSRGGGGDCPPSNQDIFGALLSETKPSSSAVQSPDVIQDEVAAHVIVLGNDHVIFSEPNIQDVMFVNGCLITCAECTSGWSLSVYCQHVKGQHVKGQSQPNDTTSKSPEVAAKQLEFDHSPSFKTFLPGRPINLKGQSSSFNTSKRLGIEETNTTDESHIREKPQLFCVFSQTMSKKEETFANAGKTLTVEDSLYNSLFGADPKLLDTPTLLTSLPDGRIYQTLLKTNRSTRSEQERARSNWIGLQTSLFFVLDQLVAFIYGLRIVPDENKQSVPTSDCICILGQYGRVVRFTENNQADHREKLKFTESFIRGPVQIACKTRTHQGIMYSTGKEVYSLSLSNSRKSDSSTIKEDVSCSPLLGLARIRALAELERPKTDVNGSSELVVLTVSGSVLKLHLPPVGSHGNNIQPITAAAAGKRMQESLQAINNITTRSRELGKLSEAQDRTLCETSKACYLASLLLGECNLAGGSRMFTVDAKCAFRVNGRLCDAELMCKVTNHSQWSLSHGWSLTVSVEAVSDWAEVAEGARRNVTKSVQLVNFQPMQTVEVIVPLYIGKFSLSLPVSIQTCLHFSPKVYSTTLLPEKDVNTESHISFVESGISLPMHKPRVIDLMTLLRPVQEDAAVAHGNRAVTRKCQATSNSGPGWLASALQVTADLRHSTNQCAQSAGNTNDKSVCVCTRLESDVSSMILEKHKNHGCSRQERVLRWLLEDNTFTAHPTNPISLLTPDGKVVTFEVKGQQKKQSTAAGGSETREAVEVVVTAPDYPTLTQLQLAINQRIKVVLESEGSQANITTTQETLRSELRKVQNLRSLHDAAIKDQLSSTQRHANAQPTLKLYQQLRTQLTFM